MGLAVVMFCHFFFSSRRRHTRFDCDWSSDVCSSDLEASAVNSMRMTEPLRIEFTALASQHVREAEAWWRLNRPAAPSAVREELQQLLPQIGRASCRVRE